MLENTSIGNRAIAAFVMALIAIGIAVYIFRLDIGAGKPVNEALQTAAEREGVAVPVDQAAAQ
jgi:hypothetical protein